jgi:hypothetical protein
MRKVRFSLIIVGSKKKCASSARKHQLARATCKPLYMVRVGNRDRYFNAPCTRLERASVIRQNEKKKDRFTQE